MWALHNRFLLLSAKLELFPGGEIVKKLMFGAALVTALTLLPVAPSHAGPPAIDNGPAVSEAPESTGNVCLDTNVSSALPKAKPGDLLAPPQDLTDEAGLVTGRIYRVIYGTSAPADATQAACAIVAVPSGQEISHVVMQGHGAWGLKQECMPSMDIRNFVPDRSPGMQYLGPLFSTVQARGAYVAPDYPAAGVGSTRLTPFLHGVSQGVSMLDAARVVTGNPEAFGLPEVAPDAELPLVITGYSQGGGAALWAAQLAKYYFDLQGEQRLDLAGVIAYEPGGTQLVAAPQEPRALDGSHLADRVAYDAFSGTIYFGWLARSWGDIKKANRGRIPFGPTAGISPSAVLSKEGLATSSEIVKLCTTTQLAELVRAGLKYGDSDKHRLLKAPFAGSKRDGKWTSAFDTTCRRAKDFPQAVRDACAWIRFNTLGPNGANPFPKIPTNNAGEPAPMYLVQGRADSSVWCVDDTGDVEARNCVTAQYYDSLKPSYCNGQGHLHVDYLAGVSHGNVFWPNLTNRETGEFYIGSPYEKFITGAIAGTLPNTCKVSNVDPR